jgi:tRNA (guanine37-N1)-methyltransferase
MRIDVLTLFPQAFESPLNCSILKRAQEAHIVEIVLTDIRDFAACPPYHLPEARPPKVRQTEAPSGRTSLGRNTLGRRADSHRRVDDKPYGGGPGMVMMPGPVFDCFEHVCKLSGEKGRVILLTPQGKKFDQKKAVELSRENRLILIAGKYEGFDERIRIGLGAEQISIGDYVLNGGELAAMVIIDAVVRLLPGVLGDDTSAKDDSFSETAGGGLEYPQYTRPEVFRGMKVPEILLSGDHKKIAEWRRQQAIERTKKYRPDLLKDNK